MKWKTAVGFPTSASAAIASRRDRRVRERRGCAILSWANSGDLKKRPLATITIHLLKVCPCQ